MQINRWRFLMLDICLSSKLVLIRAMIIDNHYLEGYHRLEDQG